MEHRYHPRVAIQNRLFIHVSNNKIVSGVTKDISNGGLVLEAADSTCLKKNMFVKVAFMVNGVFVSLASQVIRTAGNEAALMFVEETSSHKQMLKDWLNAETLIVRAATAKAS